MKKTPVDLQKRFPIYHAYSKCLAAYLCGSASRQDREKVGVTLVDWERGIAHCVRIQHLLNLSNHSDNELHSVVPEFWP